MKHTLKATSTAALLTLALGTSFAANAADKTAEKMPEKTPDAQPQGYSHNDRANMKAYSGDREALEAQLQPGMDAEFYRKKLSELGYQITAINKSKPDYVEYEVVKGTNSHEVQIDLDKATHKATKVDVALNLWRADSTKQAQRGKKVEPVTTGDYSDRAYVKGWTDEKDSLEKALGTGHDKGYYAKKLGELGYKVTSTNDKEADYLEYEVVKGIRTYEVQIDFDKASQKSSKVDVTTNLWNADATDKALAAARKH